MQRVQQTTRSGVSRMAHVESKSLSMRAQVKCNFTGLNKSFRARLPFAIQAKFDLFVSGQYILKQSVVDNLMAACERWRCPY